ncbi:hypothetical protein A1O1_06788 [Capronia coronata CBS 617.96]|uniref:25S rRNA (Uridine(2843)-N(3))-methyltransferase n=1 Tax=Capronia coronata CBS 617.96 TaxID=1182541 RepID=W9YLM1_9EURO|nr:uncharacterized protein A1O1_06788 [Capronia coronata CBS 617.96]EXJ83169.1 hypothetical protein A1O1_06788 [Capronia coronata CBS 617.96]
MAPGRKPKVSSRTTANQVAGKVANIAQKSPESVALPTEVQQMVLDTFRRAFHPDGGYDVKAAIQQVKGHLFLRDFAAAFAKQEYLEAYALRWSASRALGYSDIFLHGDLQEVWLGGATSNTTSHEPSTPSATTVACIGGGGGAEVAACAVAARLYSLSKVVVHAIDIADWSSCLTQLENAMSTPPQLSAYASERAKVANKPLIMLDHFEVRFSQRDILSVDEKALRDMLGGVGICTMMFTLNELFTTSISRTTRFLLALTDVMQVGSWLLVVDSPGSYSEVKLGQGQDTRTKQYPMKWLLDHTLLEAAGGENSKWKKYVSDDSRWFRLSPSLKYPIELENMRYQIHLYQRIAEVS